MRNWVANYSFFALRNSAAEELKPRIVHLTDPIEVR
jgi:hypothetical protein